MKTRIISAAVMIAFVIAVLTIGKLYCPLLITALVALICGMGIYELTHNAAGIKSKAVSICSSVYGALTVILLDSTLNGYVSLKTITDSSASGENTSILSFWSKLPLTLAVLYFLFSVFVILYNHKEFSLDKIAVLCAMPLFVAYGFSSINGIIERTDGIYYLLLLVNFASVCDTGAYFVGSFFGKHKLCPEISPKKTAEGAAGGIASSILVSFILLLAFGNGHIASTLLLTIPLCIIGMCGDLFASAIKRSVGLKDYGNLIPGHGGILDRFDSMLLIAPVLYLFIDYGVL